MVTLTISHLVQLNYLEACPQKMMLLQTSKLQSFIYLYNISQLPNKGTYEVRRTLDIIGDHQGKDSDKAC